MSWLTSIWVRRGGTLLVAPAAPAFVVGLMMMISPGGPDARYHILSSGVWTWWIYLASVGAMLLGVIPIWTIVGLFHRRRPVEIWQLIVLPMCWCALLGALLQFAIEFDWGELVYKASALAFVGGLTSAALTAIWYFQNDPLIRASASDKSADVF